MNDLVVDVQAKWYREPPLQALGPVRFRLRGGELGVIMGPSGSGKSTLLSLIAGLDTDFEGRIVRPGESAREGHGPGRLGFVFQTPRLMPWLTVLENLELVLEDEPREEARARARALLESVELSGFEGHYPGQLSGGMQRRVALARAFVVRPALLLLDEPFASLDAPVAGRLRALLESLWQEQGVTVVHVTHDLTEALSLADRVFFVSGRPGQVVLELENPLARQRPIDREAAREAGAALLARHPELLAGIRGEPEVVGEMPEEPMR